MKDNFQIPNLGQAPRQYEEGYLNRVIRNIEMLLQELKSKGMISVTEVSADTVTSTGAITGDTLRATSTLDVSLASTGHGLQIGPTTGVNLVADVNEIQARNNGAANELVLNNDGGNVQIASSGANVNIVGSATVGEDLDILRSGVAAQHLLLGPSDGAGHNITGFSDTTNAKGIIYNSTTDGSHTVPSAGDNFHRFLIRNVQKLLVDSSGNVSATNTFTADTLRATSTVDVSLASTGHGFQVGLSSGQNLAADVNEIMARNNGAASTLFLNADGGDVVVNNNTAGIFSLGAGGRIQFPATQNPSSNVNTLDDYEEGTWTPVLSFGGGTTGITYTTQRGSYIKVGRIVVLDIEILLSSKGSSTGTNLISGVPFSSASTRPAVINIGFWSGMAFSATTIDVALLGYGGTDLRVRHRTAASTSESDDTHFTNTSRIIATGVYLASD